MCDVMKDRFAIFKRIIIEKEWNQMLSTTIRQIDMKEDQVLENIQKGSFMINSCIVL